MEKETILAKLHISMKYSRTTLNWFKKAQAKELWFAQENGAVFFSEFRGQWERNLVKTCEPIVQSYFKRLDCPPDLLPRIVVYESYPGSWIMEAAIVMFASVGTAYTILKALAELPQIADGLTELKDRLKEEFTGIVNENIRGHFASSAQEQDLPRPPQNPAVADFVIDARPILSLTPSEMKSHKIHLSVGVSRNAFTLENLGDDTLHDIRIGLFKSDSQRNQWSYADSYMGNISLLSFHQTVTKDLGDFRNVSRQPFRLDDPHPLHVDCWVQDVHGIYLFMFYLED